MTAYLHRAPGMTTYEINTYEFKPGTEEPDTYVVSIDGKDGPLFATYAEAKEWIEAQDEKAGA